MPVYNSAKYIKMTIDSVLNQTFKEFEFIILDDCSTDNCIEIIKKYNDLRIVLVQNNVKQGHIKLLNYGIDISKGQYIARMDSDDICLPTRFEDQLEVFYNNPKISVVFTKSYIIDNKNNFICESWRPKELKNILNWLPYKNFIPHPSVMIQKNILIENEKYDINCNLNEDLQLWYKIYRNGGKFYYLKKNLLLYRINPASIQNVYGNDSFNENYTFRIIKECFSNKSKIKAIEYAINNWKKINFKEKIVFFFKLFIPFNIILYKSYLTNCYRIMYKK